MHQKKFILQTKIFVVIKKFLYKAIAAPQTK